jgi:hypothetical protein
VSGFRIEKRKYSSRPWRVVSPDGQELYCMRYLDLVDGAGHYPTPVAGSTKAEAIEALGDYAWQLHEHLQQENAS